ncbi:MAG: nucleotidyltransferase domain-containing protein [Candidatus Latescibacteria bacterium]|nr:nucleotidyltransferase domain-containing protein [Candidatus Latescibacterota bacterium]
MTKTDIYSTSKLWEITPQKVETAVKKIIEVSNPKKVILFGSYVTGYMDSNSDLDILVVTENYVKNPHSESVRIRQALRGIMMSLDIIVLQEEQLQKFAQTPGLIYREAIKKGKVVYELDT